MNILAKLKLDNHHGIERFGVLFLALVFYMCVVMGFCIAAWQQSNHVNFGNQAKYTSAFAFSRTGVEGRVVDVYRNQSFTRSFVLLYFEDLSGLSTNAEDYQLFLTGSDVNQNYMALTSSPAATFYVFGSSGYMGIDLVDTGVFDKQIMNLVIRHTSNLVSEDYNQEAADAAEDGTFVQYDQAQLYFNPGGQGGTYADVLDKESFTPQELYECFMVRPQEQELRNELNDLLKSMWMTQQQIAEYTQRVEQDGIIVPEVPVLIRGDSIEGPDDNGYYYLDTNYVLANGFDFPWQQRTVLEGYLDTLCPDGDYYTFLREKAVAEDDVEFSTSDLVWYKQDGTVFDLDNAAGISELESAKKDIDNLMGAWKTYYNQKKQYQVVDLTRLLNLELDYRSAWTVFTTSQNLTLW